MEYSVFNNQYEQLKNNLINEIESDLKEISGIVYFTNPLYYVESNDSDSLCSFYGIENGMVIADGLLTRKIVYDVRSLPIETILFIKRELDYHKKSKVISGYL